MKRHFFIPIAFCLITLITSCQQKLPDGVALSPWPVLTMSPEQLDTPCNCLEKMEEYVDALLIVQEDFKRIKGLHQKETNPDLKTLIGEQIIELEAKAEPYKEQLNVIGNHCEYSNEAFEACGFFDRVLVKLQKME